MILRCLVEVVVAVAEIGTKIVAVAVAELVLLAVGLVNLVHLSS